MKTPSPRTFLPEALVAAMLTVAAGAALAEECQEIRFQRGQHSGRVQGVAPPDDVVCYRVATGAGQTANLKLKGRNVMFSIGGVVEGQDAYSFTTEKKTYRVYVGQLMRSVTDEPFSLSVSIR
jgi:hypothetical protein